MATNETHDASRVSWLASANNHPEFPIQNLPFGVFRRKGGREAARVGVAIGDQIVDLPAIADVFTLDGWLRTGDLGEIDPEGRPIVHGRADDAIRTGGETVWPDEVEAALRSHPGVADVAVAGVPDPEWGQRVAAWIVPADRGGPGSLEIEGLEVLEAPDLRTALRVLDLTTVRRRR